MGFLAMVISLAIDNTRLIQTRISSAALTASSSGISILGTGGRGLKQNQYMSQFLIASFQLIFQIVKQKVHIVTG